MKESQDFKEKKQLLELQRVMDKEKHQHRIAELMFQRKTNENYHGQSIERMKINKK